MTNHKRDGVSLDLWIFFAFFNDNLQIFFFMSLFFQ